MPAAATSMSSYQARNQEAVRASQFSRTKQSARNTRRASRNPGASRTSSPRITDAGVSTDSVRSTSLALPENSRQSTWQQTQHEAQRSTMAPPIPNEVKEMIEETPEIASDPSFSKIQGDYAEDYRAAERNEKGSMNKRNSKIAEMKKAVQKMKEGVEKIQKAWKKANEVKEEVGRTARYTGETEFQHAGGGSYFWPSNLTTVFVVVKSILQPKTVFRTAIGKTDPDEGQFLKGFLSFIEPNVLDIKKQGAWVDFALAFLIVLILWQVFIWANMSFVIIGLIIQVGNAIANF